jgi:hypothetical protein
MGLVVLVLAGLMVASVQILVEGVNRAEALRVCALAALAALLGGSLVKALTPERLALVSLPSALVAGAASGAILWLWRLVALDAPAAADRP